MLLAVAAMDLVVDLLVVVEHIQVVVDQAVDKADELVAARDW